MKVFDTYYLLWTYNLDNKISQHTLWQLQKLFNHFNQITILARLRLDYTVGLSVRFGLKVGQIGPKSGKSETFSDQMSSNVLKCYLFL